MLKYTKPSVNCSCVVHKDVETTETVECFFDELFWRLLLREISGQRMRSTAELLDLGHCFFWRACIAMTGNPCARLGHGNGDFSTQSGCRTGDKSHTIIEFEFI